jgi:HD-GYP domain-containing protein (c-di-GMP phosphodiesterase class II)
VLAIEPRPHTVIDDAQLDSAARSIGALVDAKSTFLAGHSNRVAQCAADAGTRAGLSLGEVGELRRAGWLHDVGRAAVSSRLWDKAAPLTAVEWEQMRTHPYFSRRILQQVPGWEHLAELVGAHHERLDGSGYPDGTRRHQTASAAILAAADAYCTLAEPRPHRPAVSDPARRDRMLDAVRQGRLDAQAVTAVLGDATDLVRPVTAGGDAVLTPRELDVLALVAQGLTNAAIGSRLGVSAKTVNTHLEHIFGKLGVSCRAAAVFYAAQRGLVGQGIGQTPD